MRLATTSSALSVITHGLTPIQHRLSIPIAIAMPGGVFQTRTGPAAYGTSSSAFSPQEPAQLVTVVTIGYVLIMILFSILFGIDSIIAAVAFYFFVVGLTDGSVSSFNILLWLVLLGGIALILGSSLLLTRNGYRRRANALLLVLAFPGFAFGLLLLLALILQPRWN